MSFFGIYLLHRLITDPCSVTPRFRWIVYQCNESYTCMDLKTGMAHFLSHLDARRLVDSMETLYIVDGDSDYFRHVCYVIYFWSPGSAFDRFTEKKQAVEWFLPV